MFYIEKFKNPQIKVNNQLAIISRGCRPTLVGRQIALQDYPARAGLVTFCPPD
ncbi:MAG: hypothetical protein JWP12_1050 [Bacteroidetes bacterium]|nr:hypothetical protein [Bacteroidota bacterium]